MASFLLGEAAREKKRKEIENMESRRHYKKDSRYLEDLYTLTYQDESSMEDDSMSGEDLANGVHHRGVGLVSLQVPPTGKFVGYNGLTRSMSEGPWSLAGGPVSLEPQQNQFTSSTLDTNLHKILARRMAGGQGVSFESCKLLTKAYYSLLRDSRTAVNTQQHMGRQMMSAKDDPKLNWQTLLQTDGQQLTNIVAGYSALVKSLNEELVTELINKDQLMAEQDDMLETISELTDSLL